MIYEVKITYQGNEYPLMQPFDEELQLIDPVLTETVGKSGSFTFSIAITHPAYQYIKMLQTYVSILLNGNEIYYGRVLSVADDFYNTKAVTCEGALGFLNDSVVSAYGYTGTLDGYIDKLISEHNAQVDAIKHFYKGVIEPDKAKQIYRSSTAYSHTLNEFTEKLADAYGAYLRARREAGKTYLDLVYAYGPENTQEIRPEENMLDYSAEINKDDFYTRLIPLGNNQSSEGGNNPVTIDSVNNGKNYVDNTALITEYGIIVEKKDFDCDTPEELLAAAKVDIAAKELPRGFELSVADLNMIDASVESLKIGCKTTVISPFHGLDTKFLLIKKVSNLNEPERDTFSFGRIVKSYTKSNVEKQDAIIKNLTNSIEDTAKTITGAKTGFVVIDTYDNSGKLVQPWRILVMDNAIKENAKNVVQINQHGIGFSTSGINGPYNNAWTIDGRLCADFVKTGTMLADRIRGGTLEVGGQGLGKDGVIQVLNSAGKKIAVIDINGVDISQGKLTAPTITGGSANFGNGLFTADDDSVMLGGFEATYAWGREIFQSSDGACGMSADSRRKGGLWLWAGWQDDANYDFCVNNLGEAHAKDFYCESDQTFWKGWGLTQTMKDVYRRISDIDTDIADLWDAVNSGGGPV